MEDYERPEMTLSEAINLQDLRNPESNGVMFEVKEDYDTEEPKEEEKGYYNNPDLCNNLFTGADENDEIDTDLPPFEQLKTKMVDICPFKDGKIMKQVLKQGTGHVVPHGSVVRVHFNVYLEYSDEPFDSSRLRNKEMSFRIGEGQALEGFDFAVSTMKKDELSRFIIHPEYAYLNSGAPPRVPENTEALFEIQLLSFVEKAGLDDFFHMSEEEKRQISLHDLLKLYEAFSKEAKDLFKSQLYFRAYQKYKKALNVLESRPYKDETEEKTIEKHLSRVQMNLALCCDRQKHSSRVITYCNAVLDRDRQNAKALYLKGKAFHNKAFFEQSRDCLKRAQRLKPSDRDINQELERLEKSMKEYKIMEGERCRRMISGTSGPTKEEEKRGEEIRSKAEKKCLDVSEEFRKLIVKKLEEFKADPDLTDLPMPGYNWSVGEIECIIDTAEQLGLDCKCIGTGGGQSTQIRISKKKETEGE